MVGNPRITGIEHRRATGEVVPRLSIKANVVVVWVDESKLPDVGGLKASDPKVRAAPARSGAAALFEDAVLGIYAEGAVELLFGDLAFRAEVLHLEPRTYQGLLVRPRFDGSSLGPSAGPLENVPLHTRARRGRLVAKGLVVFDDAEVSASRADDRIALKVRTLTVQEYADASKDAATAEPATLLGFRSLSTQRYRAQRIVLQAERLPLLSWPSAEFGHSGEDPFPVALKRVDGGQRSHLGLYGFVGVGGEVGPEGDPWFDWVVDVGGYTKRGPAGGLEIEWKRPNAFGKLESWFVWDEGEDRTGFDPDGELRGRIDVESRTRLAKDLTFDAEFNHFTDRGFNFEYFERDELRHKDYESYGRLLWRPGNVAATLTGKWHQRPFVTETTEEPQAGLWVASVPVLEPASPGAFALDVTSVSRAGRLARRFDDALSMPSYSAFRADTDTRLHAGMDVGDVRLSAWAGASATSYLDRTDGGPDLVRTAIPAGVRANLQAHAVFAACGGPFQLDGLRHVVDSDLELSGRFADSHDPEDVPFFDVREQEEERSAAVLRVRNRWQTRRRHGGLRDLVDLEVALKRYIGDVGPYLLDSPGAVEVSLVGEPRTDVFVSAEADVDLDRGLLTSNLGVGVKPRRDLWFSLGFRYMRGETAAPIFDSTWRFSPKYSVSLLDSYDVRQGLNQFRLLFNRYSEDHVWSFGVSVRNNGEDFGIELTVRPTLGGETGPMPFDDVPDLDPLGAFGP
jgi:hypothetical protein